MSRDGLKPSWTGENEEYPWMEHVDGCTMWIFLMPQKCTLIQSAENERKMASFLPFCGMYSTTIKAKPNPKEGRGRVALNVAKYLVLNQLIHIHPWGNGICLPWAECLPHFSFTCLWGPLPEVKPASCLMIEQIPQLCCRGPHWAPWSCLPQGWAAGGLRRWDEAQYPPFCFPPSASTFQPPSSSYYDRHSDLIWNLPNHSPKLLPGV